MMLVGQWRVSVAAFLAVVSIATSSPATGLQGWITIGTSRYDISGVIWTEVQEALTLSIDVMDGTSVLRHLDVGLGPSGASISDGISTFGVDAGRARQWESQLVTQLWEWSQAHHLTVVSHSDSSVILESSSPLVLTDFLEGQVRLEYEISPTHRMTGPNQVRTAYGILTLKSLAIVSLDEWVNGFEQGLSLHIDFIQP